MRASRPLTADELRAATRTFVAASAGDAEGHHNQEKAPIEGA
jgi:hypothetical protein